MPFTYSVRQREKSRAKRMGLDTLPTRLKINNGTRDIRPDYFRKPGEQNSHCLNADGAPKIIFDNIADALESCHQTRLRVLWSSITPYPCVGHTNHTRTAWHIGHTRDGYDITTRYLDEFRVEQKTFRAHQSR